MDLTPLANLGEFVGGVAVLVTLIWVFRNFENYQYYVEKGLLDRGVYEGYFNTMKDTLRSSFVQGWWAVQRESYGPAFRTLVDRLLDGAPGSGSVWESVANLSLGSPRS